jgi:hypothetical protein
LCDASLHACTFFRLLYSVPGERRRERQRMVAAMERLIDLGALGASDVAALEMKQRKGRLNG